MNVHILYGCHVCSLLFLYKMCMLLYIVTVSPNEFHHVYTLIHPVHDKWKEIGLGLGLYKSTLEAIESEDCNVGRTDKCLFSVLFKWKGLEDGAFTKGVNWNILIGVLQSVGTDDKVLKACQTAANKTSHSKYCMNVDIEFVFLLAYTCTSIHKCHD